MIDSQNIIDFWFAETEKDLWFKKNSEFDAVIKQRFALLHEEACLGECWRWRTNAQGRLAEIIVLDQFSRNLHRESPKAFSTDTTALVLSQELVTSSSFEQNLTVDQKAFALMPWMHSESLVIQEQSVILFEKYTNEYYLKFAKAHKEVIEKYGRFPHRNDVLDRQSTSEEKNYLESGGGF